MSPTTLTKMSFPLPTSRSYSTKLSICQETHFKSNEEKKEKNSDSESLLTTKVWICNLHRELSKSNLLYSYFFSFLRYF